MGPFLRRNAMPILLAVLATIAGGTLIAVLCVSP